MRKYSSLTSNEVAIDRETTTTDYDTVKIVADNIDAIIASSIVPAEAAAALVSENNAAASETNSANSAAAALNSQNAAFTSESNALTSANNASISEGNALNSFQSFDDRYLGEKTADPTLDNTGSTLITGATYWNSSSIKMRVYDGTTWVDTIGVSSVGDQTINGTVSDISGNIRNGRKNLLINGNFDIWQRGNSFPNPSTSAPYTADRWQAIRGNNQTNITAWLSNIGVNSKHSLSLERITGDTTTDFFLLGQVLESQNVYLLQGKKVTFSCAVRMEDDYTGGSLDFKIFSGTAEDEAPNLSIGFATGNVQVATGTMDDSVKANSIRTISITGTVPNNARSLMVRIKNAPTGTALTSDYIRFTNMQLEVGSTATDFEYRPIAEEVALCQRYYYKIPLAGYTPTVMTGGSDLVARSQLVPMKVTPRISPNAYVSPSESTHRIEDINTGALVSSGQQLTINVSGGSYRLWCTGAVNGGDYVYKNYSSTATDIVFDSEIY